MACGDRGVLSGSFPWPTYCQKASCPQSGNPRIPDWGFQKTRHTRWHCWQLDAHPISLCGLTEDIQAVYGLHIATAYLPKLILDFLSVTTGKRVTKGLALAQTQLGQLRSGVSSRRDE